VIVRHTGVDVIGDALRREAYASVVDSTLPVDLLRADSGDIPTSSNAVYQVLEPLRAVCYSVVVQKKEIRGGAALDSLLHCRPEWQIFFKANLYVPHFSKGLL
jgi:hypothetical protein